MGLVVVEKFPAGKKEHTHTHTIPILIIVALIFLIQSDLSGFDAALAVKENDLSFVHSHFIMVHNALLRIFLNFFQ